jgi:hypothetical protein
MGKGRNVWVLGGVVVNRLVELGGLSGSGKLEITGKNGRGSGRGRYKEIRQRRLGIDILCHYLVSRPTRCPIILARPFPFVLQISA